MIHARGEVVLDDHGRPALVRGTAQDVTESRRVEDALRAAEQLFRRAFDDAPIGMALIDLEGRWLRLNRSIAQMLGRTEQDLRAMRLADVSHPDDRRLDRPLIKELLAGRRRSFAIEKRFMHADGHVIHALVHVSLMHGDGERPLYFLCQMVDVTERRRAEAAQRAGEERLQAIIDNSPALIFVKDVEHRYVLVNRRWQELFQVSADEAIGHRSADVLPPERVPGHEAMDAEVMATGTVLEAMSTVSPPGDEDERFFLLVKFPLRDPEGQIYGVCSIATDITDRRRNAKVRAELEQRLAQTQRLESVGQLAGGVAHDFNNLLSVILTCVGFAQRELPSDSPVREDVEEIGRAADRAAALTRQLLMFSRREVVKPEVIDAGALVRDLERLLNRTLSERIALRISIGPGIAPVLADRAQLEQVLVNLAVNARDAMPGGGTLAIAVNPAPGGVRITVADEGVGMEPRRRRARLRAVLHDQGGRRGHGPGARDGARHRHRLRRHGRDRLHARHRHGRDDLAAGHRRGGDGPARGAHPGRSRDGRRDGHGGRGPGPGPPTGLPDPRGPRLPRLRGLRRRGGARGLARRRRARDRRRHARHDRAGARRAGAHPHAGRQGRLHVGPHRGRDRPQRRARRRDRVRAEALHARLAAAVDRGRARGAGLGERRLTRVRSYS